MEEIQYQYFFFIPYSYFGNRFKTFINFNSCESHKAVESVTRAPDWCIAAIGTGTYKSKVVIPNPTCIHPMHMTAKAALWAPRGNFKPLDL